MLEGIPMKANKTGEGFEWKAMQEGRLLTKGRENGRKVILL
jgi:hypothetical protein